MAGAAGVHATDEPAELNRSLERVSVMDILRIFFHGMAERENNVAAPSSLRVTVSIGSGMRQPLLGNDLVDLIQRADYPLQGNRGGPKPRQQLNLVFTITV